MWKRLLLSFLVLSLSSSAFSSSIEIQEELKELKEVFDELEIISIELENESTISITDLATLRIRLKKVEKQLKDLRKLSSDVLSELGISADSLSEGEKLLKTLKRKILLQKIKYFLIGLFTGAAAGYLVK